MKPTTSKSWRTLYVAPPASGAERPERLRFVRDMQLRMLIFGAPIAAAAIAISQGTFQIVLIASLVLSILDCLFLTLVVKRSKSPR